MGHDALEAHLRTLGLTVETIADPGGTPYLVICGYRIATGPLAGEVCDLAIQRTSAIPYQPPPAIHTKPHLVPMIRERYNVLASALGDDWQYWSRTVPPERQTPPGMVAHIATIFDEVPS